MIAAVAVFAAANSALAAGVNASGERLLTATELGGAVTLAEAEGLHAHGHSIAVRLG